MNSSVQEAHSLHSTALPGSRWYCLQLHRNLERLAEANLKKQGFVTYFGWVAKENPAEKRQKIGRWNIRPLFPGYGFVSFREAEDPWFRIANTVGVLSLFKLAPEKPLPLPMGVVEHFIAQAADDGVIYPADPPKPWRVPVGASVALLSGPLAGLEGVCLWSSRDRVKLLLTLLSGPREVVVKTKAVRLAA